MSELAHRLLEKHYRDQVHPYRVFEQRALELIGSNTTTMLDAGCGRTVPVLRKFLGKVPRLIGVELVEFTDVPTGIETHNADLARLPLPDASVDLVISRSVFEHLTEPDKVYAEFSRVLNPGGKVLFLTANMWDYGTLVARAVPNRFHARIVKRVEGREEEDTFPTAYKTNTRADVNRLANSAGLRIAQFEYLSQYPNYLLFNGPLFFVGMCYEKLICRFNWLRGLRGWILVTLDKPT